MVRSIVTITLFLSVVLSSLQASAEPPVITPIKKGAPAPFAGVLLTPEAVAKIVAEAESCDKRVKAEADHARDVQKALDEKTLADAKADADRDRKVLQAGIQSRDGQIKDLTTALGKSEQARSYTWLYAGGGVIAGVVLTIGTVAIVNLTN